MTTFSITTTLLAGAATTAAADTASATPGTGWTFAAGSAVIPITAPSADWITIEFSLGAGIGLWVCSDGVLVGSTNSGTGVSVLTAGAASAIFLPPGQTQPTTISNLQPPPNWNIQSGQIKEYSGLAKDGSQSMAVGLTAQSGFSGSHSNTHWQFGPNFLAVLPSASCSGSVDITFQ
jgi:hypothetical protein